MKPILYYYHKAICFVLPIFLITSPAISQNDYVSSLTDHFRQYQTDHFQEKLFVHTDKSFYVAGELIWLKAYMVDGFFHKPCDLSKVAYIEIMDKKRNPVIQAKIAIEDATGNTAIRIPVSILSGNYLLRAYTQWMKNFGPDFFYEQPICIVNTISSSNKNIQAMPQRSYDVQFFPEGGNLINGIRSKIAFKVINQNEEGVPCKGFLINQKKDTLTKFKSLRFGMGNFSFSPEKDDHYKIIIQIEDTTIIKDLPIADDEGYAMSLSDNREQPINITIHTIGTIPDETVYLLIHSGSLFKWIQSQKLTNGTALFLVDKSKLGDGISHFTVFNSLRQPVCERLFFKPLAQKLHIQMDTLQTLPSTRDLVNISLNTQNESGENVPANLSMSVFLTDSLISTEKDNNILSYLYLTSDLKGKIESPGYYFDTLLSDKKERTEATDNLMLTQGWSRFRWDDVLQPKNKKSEFLPEREGILIHGKITEKASGSATENIMAYLSVPGKYFKFCTSKSDKYGNIVFNPGSFFDSSEIIVQTDDEIDSTYTINIIDPFSGQFSSRRIPPFTISNACKDNLLNRSIASQSENIYHKNINDAQKVIDDTLAFFGKPDNTYYLDEYTRFTSMEEVMREYVNEIRLRQNGNRYHFATWNSRYKSFRNDEPLVLMDGVPVFNASKIISFDPLKVKKIEIVTQNNYTGALISNAILSYSTYNGDLAGFPLDAGAFVLEYDGLQNQKEFYMPRYQNKEQKASRLPDMRNVLYWAPNITTDKSGNAHASFYTSDLKGRYTIIIQGLSNDGLPGYFIETFNVKE